MQQTIESLQANPPVDTDGSSPSSPRHINNQQQQPPHDEPEYTFWDRVRIGITGYWAAFILTGVMMPIISSVLLVVVYFSFPDLVKHLPPFLGLDPGSAWHILFVTHLLTLLLWLIVALVCYPFAGAASANAGSYGPLKARLCHLRAKLGIEGSDHELRAMEEKCTDIGSAIAKIQEINKSLHNNTIPCTADTCNQEALKTALASYIDLRKILYHSPTGLLWAFGAGYCNAWRLVHQAEEACIEFDCIEEIVFEARRDQLALQGSTISTRDSLINSLAQAVRTLQPQAAIYLTGPLSVNANAVTQDGEENAARSELRKVRNVLNYLQDRSWEGMLRARNRLLASIAITGIATHLLLCITILLNGVFHPGNQSDPLIAVTAFYLVAAVTGLFGRFYQESTAESAIDDFGFSTARLVATPLLSGLAGIGGVLLLTTIATLSGQGNQNGLDLGQIFVVKAQLLLMAAVFGLTPNLLITGLQNTANRYASDIRSSGVAESDRTSPQKNV